MRNPLTNSITKTVEERFDVLAATFFPQVPPLTTHTRPLITDEDHIELMSAADVRRAVLEFNPNKAPGPDGIFSKTIQALYKSDNPLFRDRLNSLFQACQHKGYHPTEWKTSHTVIIPKPHKKDKASLKSYRPIALLNTMGKMLERVFCNSITAFIDRSSILNEYQFGCRKGYSAPDALLKLINDIKSKQETNPKTRTSAIMVDIKGAFDNVDHKHLLETLDKKNFPQGTIEWISSFITNRSTAIITDGIVDKTRPTTKGIPQGSPLSPILFNIYTTGLYHRLSEIPGIKFAGFVDDVTIYCHDSQARATNSLGLALKACVEWATKAHTEIDLGDKLNFIHFGNKTANPPRLPVPCQQTLREPQDEAKVLGVILDRKLNFKPHISLKKEQAIQAINFITRLGGTTDGLTGFAFKLLYNSCIVPIISYGWGMG
ncbi:uncharacterized protein SAPINGB_P002037 [Magnusiomyces paraingens]|uniref:Reverse transcriptase domain-containing protein n=1 Tax=Magnusiomyces paraingens TaxID=2606893 RepID=A0A5E8BE27_9ASCO|nr:uncharacterized protein SAPINGB_P002037 [Saprochaete ingens]VVT48963.1 unnamed protein product [Saprochaete ingens]